MISIVYTLLFVVLIAMVITGVILIAKSWFQPQEESLKNIKIEVDRLRNELSIALDSETKMKAQLMEAKRDQETAQANIKTAISNEEAAVKKLQDFQANSRQEEYRLALEASEKNLLQVKSHMQLEIQNALDLIAGLRVENDRLKGEGESWKIKTSELKEGIDGLQKESELEKKKYTDQFEQLKEENAALKTKLSETGSMEAVKEELNIARQTFEDSLTRSKGTIDKLNAEKQNWESQINRIRQDLLLSQNERQELAIKTTAAIDQLTREKNALLIEKEKNLGLIAGLKKDLNASKTDGALQLTAALDLLKEENRILQNKMNEQTQKLREKESLIDVMENQRTSDDTLRVASRTVDELRGQNQFLQREIEDKLAQVHKLEAQVSSLTKDEEVRYNELQTVIDHLLSDKNSLTSEKDDMERGLQKIKEFNATLLEKEQILQYELTKSRAQSIGLERISEDFKNELERYRNENIQLRQNNQTLGQKMQSFEERLNALELANFELSQKEKTSQTELAKSRQRLSSVEKSYESFKAKLKKIELSDEDKDDVEDI